MSGDRRRVTAQALVSAIVTACLLAGCGSQLQPDEVQAASVSSVVEQISATTIDDAPVAPPPPADTTPDISLPRDSSDADVVTLAPNPLAPDDQARAVPGPDTESPKPTDGRPAAGSCDGFDNSVGITDETITIGNAADVSGPQPGIFEASQDAVRAYVAYFNATSDICGRKLALTAYDTRTDGVAEQEAYTRGCQEVFAMIGSMSAFDASGAGTAASCGLPDLRTAGITPERINCRTCFGALSSNPGEFQNAIPDFVLKQYGDAGQHAAMFYINIGAAPDNAKAQVKIFEKRGMNFDIVQAIDIAEFNYTPYAQQMKDAGIKYVQMIGSDSTAVRLAQAMQQQSFKPVVFMNDPSVYKPAYASAGGTAVEGSVVFTSLTPFEEADRNPELRLYTSWLDQVRPGVEPTFFGAYAWSAARLFVEQAAALGGRLDRESLVSAVRRVDGWTSQGMHAPQRVGIKRVGECNRFIELRQGRWVPVGGTKYTCTGTTTVN
ncbi:MAG: ABC transporter substrate-binding protein [Nocardioides sp.]